jgi:hypothetical protein
MSSKQGKARANNLEQITNLQPTTTKISKDWLLVAFHLYRTTHSLSLIQLSYPNLNLSRKQNTSIILNLQTLGSYKQVLPQAIFLELKNQFNLQAGSQQKSFSNLNSKYTLVTSDAVLSRTYTQPTYVNSLIPFGFNTRLISSSILEGNLKLAKQSR